MKKNGWIEVICGPMFAGKTELIRRVRSMDFAKKNYIIFKPSIDDRYSINEVVSHNKRKVNAVNVSGVEEMKKFINDNLDAVVIDEVQFFEKEVVDFAGNLADKGYRVICAGLDSDFRGIPFENMANLLAVAESVTKLTAICPCCGNDATRTQRIINGMPAYFDDPIILVGEKESYEPRCRSCHEVLRRD